MGLLKSKPGCNLQPIELLFNNPGFILQPLLIGPWWGRTDLEGEQVAKQAALKSSECPVARTLESIGDRWSLLIIRDAFDGIRRFSEFQKSLGLAKNILAARLKALVALGVFDIRPASDGSAYKEYVLTEQGRETFAIVVCLRQWGERYLFTPGETHSVLLDNASGQPVMPLEVRSAGGNTLGPEGCHRERVTKR
ncbi:helix-turn-helix transcriptional regulator [Pseudomonas sp. C2L11]|nr:helix-turn-helix transcriptional regulator [Pseudomonas typographi]